jgi:hypothetical protein
MRTQVFVILRWLKSLSSIESWFRLGASGMLSTEQTAAYMSKEPKWQTYDVR